VFQAACVQKKKKKKSGHQMKHDQICALLVITQRRVIIPYRRILPSKTSYRRKDKEGDGSGKKTRKKT